MLRQLVTRTHPHLRRTPLQRSLSSQSDLTTHTSPSVNQSEVDKFRHISSTWWDPQGPFKYLHTMNHARTRYIHDRLSDLGVPLAGSTGTRPSAIDVGCGGGLASESLGRLGLSVLGVDAALENVRVAREHLQGDPLLSAHVRYRQMTAEQVLAEHPEGFACVAALEVIEHVAQPLEFVRTLVQLAQPGAPVFLSTMNRTWVSWLVDIVAPEYLLGSVPRGTHQWHKFVPPHELQDMLRAAGAETVDVRGLVLDPVANSCHVVERHCGPLADAGVQANYILCAVKHKK